MVFGFLSEIGAPSSAGRLLGGGGLVFCFRVFGWGRASRGCMKLSVSRRRWKRKRLRPMGMEGVVGSLEVGNVQVGVDLGGVEAGMAEHFLDDSDVGTRLVHVGRARVTEEVAGAGFGDSCGVELLANPVSDRGWLELPDQNTITRCALVHNVDRAQPKISTEIQHSRQGRPCPSSGQS